MGLFIVALVSPCFTQYRDEVLQISEANKSFDKSQQPALLLVRNLDDDGDGELREDLRERAWVSS